MEQLTLNPISHIQGVVNLPGSKSVSNRALLLGALAKGKSRITNLLDSDDTRYMLKALSQLGIEYQLFENNTVCEIQGRGKAFDSHALLTLYLGNAGTVMRPLTAALCLGCGEYILTGDERMKERPIGHLVDALRSVGANIEYLEMQNFPPLKIMSQAIEGGRVEIDGRISSQFLTAFLMAAPLFIKDTQINIKGHLVSKPYIDLTINMMSKFGVEIINENYQRFFVKGGQTYKAVSDFLVEGDASSASYFLAAAAIKGGEVKVTGIGKNSIQGDIQFANALALMGATIEWGDNYIIAKRNKLVGIDMDFNHIPDAAMTIATTALFAKGTTIIRNVYNWRVKETDRLSAMATELRKVGAKIEQGDDYLKIEPPAVLNFAQIDTYDDHRMGMCFSLLALAKTGVAINNPKCTAKTFPHYFAVFMALAK